MLRSLGWEKGSVGVRSEVGLDPRESVWWIIGMENKCCRNVSLLNVEIRKWWVVSDLDVDVHSWRRRKDWQALLILKRIKNMAACRRHTHTLSLSLSLSLSINKTGLSKIKKFNRKVLLNYYYYYFIYSQISFGQEKKLFTMVVVLDWHMMRYYSTWSKLFRKLNFFF